MTPMKNAKALEKYNLHINVQILDKKTYQNLDDAKCQLNYIFEQSKTAIKEAKEKEL